MALELHINNQIADIDEDTEVTLTKEFEDDDDSMERKQAEYSYELELPITARNQKIFGYANDIQVKHKFYQVYNAQLYADHILVLDGKFMLSEIDNNTFTGNLYVPSTKDLSDILGDLNLNEIKEHNISLSKLESFRDLNFEAMATGIDVSGKNNYVIFPYILYNFARSNFGSTDANKYVQFTNYSETTYDYNKLYPSYNVCKVIEEIFDTFGYKVSGNIFNDKRFTELWMTSSFDNDDYKDNLNYPQYLDLSGYYYNVRTNSDGSHTESNTDEYIELTDQYENKEQYYCDDLLHCSNSQLHTVSNDHGIFVPKGDQGSVIVKKSGWYQIYFDGYVEINNNGYESDKYFGNLNSYSNIMSEIRLVKGNARENTKFISRFGEAPICPRSEETKNTSWGYSNDLKMKVYGWSSADAPTNIRIPRQGGVAIVHDYSAYDTSNFICGARFGNFANFWDTSGFGDKSLIYKNTASDITKRNLKYALPNTDNISRLLYDTEADDFSFMLPLYYFDKVVANNTAYRKPAVVLMSENAKLQYAGYTTCSPFETYMDDGHVYKPPHWVYNVDKTSLNYIRGNSASIGELTSGDMGSFQSSCVYYLEEGDTLNVELLDTIAWFQTGKKRVPMTVYFNLQMGLVSTDKSWEPDNNKNTIPYYIHNWENEQTTNINQFLPEMSCNDFLEAFMKTFNLRVTKIDEKEYSINYSDTRQTALNIVPLDKYFDKSKVTEKSIDIPSAYNWKFEINEDEEGYTTGDDSPFNEKGTNKEANELPFYSGSKTIVNQTNTTEDTEDVESRFSYNWYKTVWFTDRNEYTNWVAAGKPNLSKWSHKGTVMKVPIIADADVWEKSFSDGQSESDKVSATPRFFYMNRGKYISIYSDDSVTPKLILPTVTNSYNSFDLDFNDIPSFTGIESTFFATNISPSYEIYIEMAMSNEDYKRIQENTLIRINGELFRVVKIDGHDVGMQNDADVVLKALV